MTNPTFCNRAVQRTVQEFGRLDVLVNNAAYQQHVQAIAELSDEQWEHTFRTNVVALNQLVREVLPHLAPGAIVAALSSETVAQPRVGLAAYAASKAALEASIAAWKRDTEHQQAQRGGRATWYADYTVRVAKVERAYGK